MRDLASTEQARRMTGIDGLVKPAIMTQVVREVVGRADAELGDWHVEAVDYHSPAPSTMSLSRVKGTTTWGETWSVFVKSIGSPRHWPFITVVPEDMRDEFILFF